MKNYHILRIHYVAQTNTKPSRIKIVSERFMSYKFIPYTHDYNNTLDIALAWFKLNGWDIVGTGEGSKNGVGFYYLISNTFKKP